VGSFAGTANFGDTDLVAPDGGPFGFAVQLKEQGTFVSQLAIGANGHATPTAIARRQSQASAVAGSFSGTIALDSSMLTASSEDGFVIGLDPTGKPQWGAQIKATAPGTAHCNAVAYDALGALYVAGSFSGTVDFGNSKPVAAAGDQDIFVMKLDAATGALIWERHFGDTAVDEATAIAFSSSGAAIITGRFSGKVSFDASSLDNKNGDADVFIAGLDPSGMALFARQIGGPGDQIGRALALDALQNIVVVGDFTGEMTGPGIGASLKTAGADRDAFILKFDSFAVVASWALSFGDTKDQFGTGVAIEPLGDVAMTGYFFGGMKIGAASLMAAGSGSSIYVARMKP
jgi:hypothetical protein